MGGTKISGGVHANPNAGGEGRAAAGAEGHGREKAHGGQEASSPPGRAHAAGRRGADGVHGPGHAGPDKADKPDHADKPDKSSRGRGNSDVPARVREVESQGQHVRRKLENSHGPKADRLTDDTPGKERGRDVEQARGDRHGNDDDHEVRLRSRTDADANRARGSERKASGEHGEARSPDTPHGAPEGRGRRTSDIKGESSFEAEGKGESKNAKVKGDHSSEAKGDRSFNVRETEGRGRDLPSAALEYLRGRADRHNLPADVRAAFDRAAAELLGPDRKGDEKVFKLIEHTLGPRAGTRPAEHAHGHTPGQLVRQVADELLEAAQLGRHFRQLEKSGGNVVRQAEMAAARLLYGARPAGETAVEGDGRRPTPVELLQDLRAGAFRPTRELHNPFPLTGRARVAAEMMELMRTLDAIERALGRLATRPEAGPEAAQKAGAASGVGHRPWAGAVEEALDEFLALVLPTLPGRAGRNEIPRLVAALDGLLLDAEGRALLAKDGTPLKLDRLVWLSTAGGLVNSSFGADSFPTRLSPLLVYGFDAIYSAIGFDGRTLASPHFVVVQAQVNASEAEWVFGQQPLTDGWMRALIERLKDSAWAGHNHLGEMLEEALADGRFHAALVRGTVEEGEAVAGSFSVRGLLPGAAGEAAFA